MLDYLLGKRKATVGELERLAGFLNFLNKAVVLGRTFTRRMYAKFLNVINVGTKIDPPTVRYATAQKLRSYHHVHLDREFKSDCEMWKVFLSHISVVCCPFADFQVALDTRELSFYSDASQNPVLGFGAIFNTEWTYHQWEKNYIEVKQPSIQYIELFALCIGVFTWSHKLKNGKFLIWCDNKSTRDMVNSGVSKCRNCMFLLRMLTLDNVRA